MGKIGFLKLFTDIHHVFTLDDNNKNNNKGSFVLHPLSEQMLFI